jgi:peptidoglycan/LPS O-acetylase OafA/YrhL
MLAPVGLALLVEAGLLRRLAEAEGLSADALDSTTVVAVEGAGVALLVGPAFVELFTRSVAYGVIALLVGVALAGWGILTRVRRRLATGAGVTVLAVVLMVVVPLAEAMPAAGGAALWIGIAIAGIVAIGLATLLESGRARLGRAVEQLRSLTSDWR